MEEMEKQATHVGAEIIHDTIVAAHLHERPIRAIGDSGTVYTCDTIIIATGAQAKWLGLPSEQKLQGFGVSACATCDGFFFKGKAVAVIGGGNTAVEEAIYLTHHASSVTLIHRRDSFRAEKIMQDRLFANDKITVVWDSVVDEILGGDSNPPGVSGVKIKNVKTGATSTIPVDGVFVAIGHTPNTALFKEQITVDSEGY
ncbi:MAG: FAD-dependent oxidoreductase, partial [Ferruginibacter sp.]